MLILICVQEPELGEETMLHYDMIRYEIMYLKMLGALSTLITPYSGVLMIPGSVSTFNLLRSLNESISQAIRTGSKLRKTLKE